MAGCGERRFPSASVSGSTVTVDPLEGASGSVSVTSVSVLSAGKTIWSDVEFCAYAPNAHTKSKGTQWDGIEDIMRDWPFLRKGFRLDKSGAQLLIRFPMVCLRHRRQIIWSFGREAHLWVCAGSASF